MMVEPYMLSRGAGAQGPTEVVKLMQKNLKRPTVLYFCLMSIAKMELRESEMGLATKEASACVLQTLKTLTRYPKNEPLVAVSYTHLRAHETTLHLVCRLLLEKKKPGQWSKRPAK